MFGMRRWAEALRDFKACNDKSLQHKCAIVHFELASVQFKGGNLKQALALLDEVSHFYG